jgi:hypothetical protein
MARFRIVGNYEPGITSGEILIPPFQYEEYVKRGRGDDFKEVYPRPHVKMYRFVGAPTPYVPPYDYFSEYVEQKTPEGELGLWDREFIGLVSKFDQAIKDYTPVNRPDVATEEEDYEFVYGAFVTAVCSRGMQEVDWVLMHVVADIYQIAYVPDVLDTQSRR